jgi:hypothetical protein
MKQATPSNSPILSFFASANALIEVSCKAIDALVTAYFGQPNDAYSCATFQSWATSTRHLVDLTGRQPLDKYDLATINDARHGQFQPNNLDVYLKYLVKNGVIPPAKYIVQVA